MFYYYTRGVNKNLTNCVDGHYIVITSNSRTQVIQLRLLYLYLRVRNMHNITYSIAPRGIVVRSYIVGGGFSETRENITRIVVASVQNSFMFYNLLCDTEILRASMRSEYLPVNGGGYNNMREVVPTSRLLSSA